MDVPSCTPPRTIGRPDPCAPSQGAPRSGGGCIDAGHPVEPDRSDMGTTPSLLRGGTRALPRHPTAGAAIGRPLAVRELVRAHNALGYFYASCKLGFPPGAPFFCSVRVGTKHLHCTLFAQTQVPAQPLRSPMQAACLTPVSGRWRYLHLRKKIPPFPDGNRGIKR